MVGILKIFSEENLSGLKYKQISFSPQEIFLLDYHVSND